jgi:hypothetical protein
MADNLFGIEEDFPESHRVNDILFSDEPLKDIEEEKKKQELLKKEETEKKEKENLLKTPLAKKDDKIESVLDPNESLFGDKDDNKDEESKDEDVDDDPEKKDTVDQNQFEILSNELYKLGIFVPDVDAETGEETLHSAKSGEEFKKLFEYQKQVSMYAAIDAHLSRFGEDRLELFDAIFNKGVDPKEYLPIYNEIQNFEELSLDTESNQEKVVREAYKRNGLSEDKISTRIQRLKDMSELQSEAEDVKTMLIEQDKKSLKDQEDKKAAQLEFEKNKDAQYKTSLVKILNEKVKTKDFDGIPVTEQIAQKTYDFLYNKKWQGGDGKKFTDFDKFILELNKPENHSLKVKVGLLAQNEFDLTKVQKKAISKESSELFKEFAQKKTKQAVKKETAAAWNL